MRKLFLALALLCLPGLARAQTFPGTTTVNLTAAMGSSYAGGPVFAHQITFAGQGLPGYSTFFDPGGNLALTIPGGTYQFTFCNASGTCFGASAALVTNVFNITTIFTNAANASSGGVSSVFTRVGAITAQTGDYTCAQVTNCSPNIPAPSTFYISNACNSAANCLQWVDDDSTDNCGAATTAFVSAINTAAGVNPGFVNVIITGGGSGKGYVLKTCNLVFASTTGVGAYNIQTNATFDASTNSSANLIQFSDGTHGGQFRWTGGTFIGGASLTVAGIEIKNSVGNAVISDVSWRNFGAGNATLGSCTNYAIQFDNFVFEGTVIKNFQFNDDSTTGRCFGNNATTTNGEGTIMWSDNVIGGKSGSVCASQGIVEGGFYGSIINNNIGNTAIPIRLQGGGHNVIGNQLDTEGCTANGVNAVINYGPTGGATGNIDGAKIAENQAQMGGSHATNFIQKAGDTAGASSISTWSIVNNAQTVTTSSSANLIGGGASCGVGQIPIVANGAFCYEFGNTGFINATPCGASPSGYQLVNVLASCGASGATANVGPTTALTSPNSTIGTIVIVANCQVVLTTAAGTSSTLPQCEVVYTDATTNTTQTVIITPVWASGTVGCSGTVTNTVGNSCQGTSGYLNPKKNTTVSFQTINYASNAAATMQYQVWMTLVNAD